MNLVNRARRILIQLGKILPFLICFVVLLSYCECLWSMFLCRYITFIDYTCAQKPISHAIAKYFEYDMMMVLVCLILSVATETCVWNKVAITYLALHILFKHYIESIEITMQLAIILCIANIIINGFLVFKGVKKAFST